MPFKEIHVKEKIKELRKDPEFNKCFIEIDREYSFIRQVVEARKEKGLTQKALAGQIGVSQQEISRFERLLHVPRLSSLMKIIDAIGLELKLVNKEPEAEGYSSRLNDREPEYCRELDE